MSEPRIGRVLVASLHQAIADLLPTRLEFYENWINVVGLREGTIGLAPLSAVLSFLRTEGEAYGLITARAGEYAGEWSVNTVAPLERRIIQRLPAWLRTRAALRIVRGFVRTTYPGSRAIIRVKGTVASVDLRGSLFCEVREVPPVPLCGFYAAAIDKILSMFDIHATTEVAECRAGGGRKGCLLSVVVNPSQASAEEQAVA